MTNLKCYKCSKVKPLNAFPDARCWWCLDCLKAFLPIYLTQMHPRKQLWALFKEERNEFFPNIQTKISVTKPLLLLFIKENPRCGTTDIIEAFKERLSGKYCRIALKQMELEGTIDGIGIRPRKYALPHFQLIRHSEEEIQEILTHND